MHTHTGARAHTHTQTHARMHAHTHTHKKTHTHNRLTAFGPAYIDITAETSHSSTPSLRIAQLITSLGTLSKAF